MMMFYRLPRRKNMGNLTVKFIDKEYCLPSDLLTYIGLLDFTDSIKNHLINTFLRKLRSEIAKDNTGLLDDKDLAAEIEEQVGKFITKLCDEGIYTRTIADYLNNSKGYQLFSSVNKAALEKMKSIMLQQLDDLQSGYEDAVNRAESHITGMGFSIWSSSFVNHAIYAAMQASTLNKQGKEAETQYQRDMSELCTRLDAQYGGEKSNYINNTYIPSMETALTVFSYELLDKYVADLIKNGKFDIKTLEFIDIGRSNDLLKNLALSGNKKAILENAFVACPYNLAVYMEAMRMEILDVDTFETANIFNLGAKIISYLKESLGVVNYPKLDKPNGYSASLLARYSNKQVVDVLYEHTEAFANTIIREYEKLVNALNIPSQCREYLTRLSDDEILSGESAAKQLATSLVYSIAPKSTWDVLVTQWFHGNLFERLQSVMPKGVIFSSKEECDSYLINDLYVILEAERKKESQRILNARARAEEEKNRLAAQKRKKQIKITIISCVIIAAFILAISLPSIIKNANISKREKFVDSQINSILNPLEEEMEEATGVDIIFDYSFSIENDWDTEIWYDWQFSVRLPIFEEYRTSKNKDDESLLEVMDVCKTLVQIYDNVYDDLDFEFKYKETRVVMDFRGGYSGTLSIHDLSSSETFIYEEHSGNRYLHSLDTEYVLMKDVKQDAYNEAVDLMSEQKYSEAIAIFEELGNYKDCETLMADCKNAILELEYNEAIDLMSEQKYSEAITIFEELGNYKNCETLIVDCENAILAITETKYINACSLMNAKSYKEASLLFDEIGDYKDAIQLNNKCKFIICEAGDIITFGSYEQDGNSANGKEDIEWIVMLRDGNKAFVISKYCLERMPFHSTLETVTWKDSSVRTWLNNDFYNTAFSSTEKNKICNTTFSTEGVETTDKVFLLDKEDASLLPNLVRVGVATDYCSSTYCNWFLRNTGNFSNVAYVGGLGEMEYYEDVDREWWIRPAMWITIDEN